MQVTQVINYFSGIKPMRLTFFQMCSLCLNQMKETNCTKLKITIFENHSEFIQESYYRQTKFILNI